MNIFILDEDMKKSCSYYMDKHMKIILECAHMLSLAHNLNGGQAPYKAQKYANNEISKWVRANKSNYRWTVKMGLAICEEYTYRYGRTHKTQAVLEWLRDNEPNIPDGPMTPHTQAIAEECKGPDVVEAYREYYIKCKRHLAKWKNRPIPDWWR